MKTQQTDDANLYQYWRRGSNEAAGNEGQLCRNWYSLTAPKKYELKQMSDLKRLLNSTHLFALRKIWLKNCKIS
jgi:hypothetical protein